MVHTVRRMIRGQADQLQKNCVYYWREWAREQRLFKVDAARVIQRRYRGRLGFLELLRRKARDHACRIIQACVRVWIAKNILRNAKRKKQEDEAKIVFLCRKIFMRELLEHYGAWKLYCQQVGTSIFRI